MKKLIILFFLLNQSYAQKIDFIEKFEFDSILYNSNEKLILIDFYTTWCGPCKRMDKEVFTDSLIIKKIKSNFISLKVNAEEGQGITLAKKYNVASYPTYLFLNNKGVPVYKTIGYMSSEDFNDQITNAILESKEKITLIELDSLFVKNSDNLTFLKDYLIRRTKLKLDNSDLLDIYISLLPHEERTKTETLQLIADNGNRINKSLQIGISLQLLQANKNQLKSLKDAYSIEYYIEFAKKKTLLKAIEFKSDSLLNLVLSYTDTNNIVNNAYTVKLEYFKGIKNSSRFYSVAKDFYDAELSKYSLYKLKSLDSLALNEILSGEDFKESSPEELNEIKKDFKHLQSIRFVRIYNSITDFITENDRNIAHLLQAEKWAKKSVEICLIDSAYFRHIYPHSLNNLAKIHYLLNKKQLAIRYQSLAVSLSSKQGDEETTEVYKKQLALMKKGKSL